LDNFLPQFLPIFAFANVEDSSGLHRHTPVEKLAPDRQLRLPIPHTVHPRLLRAEAERIAGLKPTGRFRVTWAGRFDPTKRPEAFVRIAKELVSLSEDVDVVMVGATAGPALALIQADPILRARVYLPGRVSNETLSAIGQASDLMVFTASISVTGTIFREALAAHVPAACTIDPSDSLLFTLVDVGKDVLALPLSSPRRAAEIILAALRRPGALAEQADRAAHAIAARGMAVDEFVTRVSEFFFRCGQDARSGRG
jgi:glycosyltransferase involved in cell wall biosynthesis